MPDKESVERDDAGDLIELTSEDRERLQETTTRLRQALGPRTEFDFPPLERLIDLAKVASPTVLTFLVMEFP